MWDQQNYERQGQANRKTVSGQSESLSYVA